MALHPRFKLSKPSSFAQLLQIMLVYCASAYCGSVAQAQPLPEGGVNPFVLPPLPADAPRPSPDPHNLEGTWYHQDLLEIVVAKTMYGKPVPFNEKAKALMNKRAAAAQAGQPFANTAVRCRPPGPIWQLDINIPFSILQTQEEIDFVFREFHGVWKIRMNQPHRSSDERGSDEREYMGDSVGHWEGDTLVVDTINFKHRFWVDSDVTGAPLSRNAHLVHRIRKIDEEDGPALAIMTTIDDPTYFTSKWSIMRTFIWRPDQAMFEEYNCEDQMGDADGVSRYGFIDEPESDE